MDLGAAEKGYGDDICQAFLLEALGGKEQMGNDRRMTDLL
jgi:hypothetical protein